MEENGLFDYSATWRQNGVKTSCHRIEKIPDDEELFGTIKKIYKIESLKPENFQNFKLVFNTQDEFLDFVRKDPDNIEKPDCDMRISEFTMKSIIRNNNNSQIQNLCKIVFEIFTANKTVLRDLLHTYLICIDEKLTLSYLFADCEDKLFIRVEKITLNESIPRATEVVRKLHLFPSLKYLNLNKSLSKTEESFRQFNAKLPQLKNLLYLNLAGNNLGSVGMKILFNLRQLKHLNTLVLTENNIQDEGMKLLRDYIVEENLPICELYINKNGLSIDGYRHYNEIAHTNFQRVLDFSNTPLSPEILETIMDTKKEY